MGQGDRKRARKIAPCPHLGPYERSDMENSQIEEPDPFDNWPERNKWDDCLAGECDCDLCVICDRLACTCVCEGMPQYPEILDIRDAEAWESLRPSDSYEI